MKEDIEPRPPDAAGPAGERRVDPAADAGPEPQEPAQAWQEEREALQDRYLRLAAEFENYKKRMAREHQDRVRGANAELLRDLLEIVDNFERALAAEHEDSAYARGVTLIHDQLQKLLARRGVERLQVDGQKFDPEFHEALLHLPSEEVPTGHVCRDLRRGYLLHGRTLRPAQVAVSSGSGEPAPGPGDTSDAHE